MRYTDDRRTASQNVDFCTDNHTRDHRKVSECLLDLLDEMLDVLYIAFLYFASAECAAYMSNER